MMKMYSMHGMGMDPSMFGGSETLVLDVYKRQLLIYHMGNIFITEVFHRADNRRCCCLSKSTECCCGNGL